MKPLLFFLALTAAAIAQPMDAVALEKRVAETAADPKKTTVIHFWAPWCANCNAELAGGAWAAFIAKNPGVNFIFLTVWSAGQGDGRALLAKNGVGSQPNFQLFFHPNEATGDEKRLKQFLGYPLEWIPSTWVLRKGKLRYALNYGELRFNVLQQLLDDAGDNWDR